MKTIALIGRPNVGKSSLFNALLGFRRAIVFDEPGTTRDRVVQAVKWGPVRLMDSQGIADETDEVAIREAIDHADAIAFVVDGLAGITPFDRWISQIVKSSKKPALLCINKCDRANVYPEDFAELGYENVCVVSAEHRRGLDAVKEFCLRTSPAVKEPIASEVPETTVFQLAILGRPNTGKSTLMNRLSGEAVSRVSPEALTTRDPVAFEIVDGDTRIRLMDTAGIRRPRSEKSSVETFSIQASTRMINESDVVFLMVDAHEGLVDQDMRLFNLIQRSGRPAAILLNFWDRLDSDQRRHFLSNSEFEDIVKELKVVPLSALQGLNCPRLIPLAKSLYKRANQRVPTSKLNKIVQALVQKNPPPMGGKGNFNILYASQTRVHPPTFVFFMNRKAAFPKAYSRYLENQLKERLALQSQSIRILFRERSR